MIDELRKAVFERMIFGDSGCVDLFSCLEGMQLICIVWWLNGLRRRFIERLIR